MYISGQGLLIMLLVGLVAGWLAGKLVAGGGFGLIADIAIGIVGAFIGTWLLPQLGLPAKALDVLKKSFSEDHTKRLAGKPADGRAVAIQSSLGNGGNFIK